MSPRIVAKNAKNQMLQMQLQSIMAKADMSEEDVKAQIQSQLIEQANNAKQEAENKLK